MESASTSERNTEKDVERPHHANDQQGRTEGVESASSSEPNAEEDVVERPRFALRSNIRKRNQMLSEFYFLNESRRSSYYENWKYTLNALNIDTSTLDAQHIISFTRYCNAPNA